MIDYRRLASLLTNLGISPDRLELAVERAVLEDDAQGLARLSAAEKRLVYYALGEGLASLRHDQDAALRATGLTVSTFRSEARLYQGAFLCASRRTNWLLAALIVLTLAILLLQWAGMGAVERGTALFCRQTVAAGLPVVRDRLVVPSLALGFGELAVRTSAPARVARRLATNSGQSRRIAVRGPGGVVARRFRVAGAGRA
ncbi:hypothetical protein [Novosphingobium sp. CECT 9465]|uniref:hypothetical protein n=1 Tax=Novosphingobium sp. CECT 9465 TaxID=2829794 RepID=UPI001E4339C5|nr:hypothetical protein [Novosphingobium sp. CECT 9465]